MDIKPINNNLRKEIKNQILILDFYKTLIHNYAGIPAGRFSNDAITKKFTNE